MLVWILRRNRLHWLSQNVLDAECHSFGQHSRTFSPVEPFTAIVFNEILYYIDLGRALTLATQWTHGVGWVLASVFDFPKGREVLETLHKNVDVRSSCSVRNELDSLVWNVVAGRLVSIGHPC